MTSSRHLRLQTQEILPPSLHDPDGKALPPPRPTLRRSILRTREWLLSAQSPEGWWVGELEGDSILQSEYMLLLAFLGEVQHPHFAKCARRLLDTQMEDGGWGMYPGGPIDVSASVKAYFALKIFGMAPHEEPLRRARAAILAAGGAEKVNSFTRFYLALLGQISYDLCPSVPPEFALLPKWFPINLARVSAWSRTMIVPLAVMSSKKPLTALAPEQGIRELYLRAPEKWEWPVCPGKEASQGFFSWRSFFLGVDRCLKAAERWKILPLRRRALKVCEQWMTDRFEKSEGLGAIFPPMVWSVIAMKALGYPADHPAMVRARAVLADLVIEEDDSARLQPCKSPVWDTAISLIALADCGLPTDHPAVVAGQEWLLAKQTTLPGDWSDTVAAPPGGWYFEFDNEFYPDVDDTAMVMMALSRRFDAPVEPVDELSSDFRLLLNDVPHPRSPSAAAADMAAVPAPPLDFRGPRIAAAPCPLAEAEAEAAACADDDRVRQALSRAEVWMLAMQNRDGGWGAFDRDNDQEWLCNLPFADHNAMIDPSTPDLTARVLEALGKRGLRVGHPAVDRAIVYLRRTQEADGAWFGRWGVNYVYGVWQTLVGLQAVGVPSSDPMMQAGGRWLLVHQQEDGGWGESPDSYADPGLRGQGESTASQTAWGLMGLLAAGLAEGEAASRAVEYLLSTQREDGLWDEPQFTGTGFPQVFYLRYHYYPIYFPLMAMSRYAQAKRSGVIARSGEED